MPATPTANISSKPSQPPSRHPEHDPPSAASSPPPPPPSHPAPPARPPTSRPPKRQRPRPSSMAAERASSGSDSSSQSGIADNEAEAELVHPSEHAAPPLAVPPKKKRTRTLTTPHQSAVLHALLEKSRFPTTAMREEVGRQIGLSARKVQIWFQNQRQKARRPQSDSAPLTRPPQFGPFPIITSAGPSSFPSPTTRGPVSRGSHSAPTSAHSAHDSAASPDSSSALPGPTPTSWPSPSRQRAPPSAEGRDPPLRPPASPISPSTTSPYPRLSPGMSTRDSRASARGPAPHATQSTPVEISSPFSGVLPPISFNALESRSSTDPYVSATSFPPQPPLLTFVNTVTVQHHPFAHHAIEQGSPVRPSLPPPLVLQPQPQWDPQTFVPYTRPQFASWLRSSSSSPRTTFSPVAPHDRVMHPLSPDAPRRRHVYSSSGDPGPSHRTISPLPSRRHRRFSTSASSPASLSVPREGRARSVDEEE